MKKILTVVALGLATLGVNAQIKTNAGTFTKPSKGSWLVEGSFMPNFSSNSMFGMKSFNNTTGFAVRNFTSDSKAMRYFGALSVSNDGTKNAETAFGISLGIGVENHTKGAERLSAYWGYGVMAGYAKDIAKNSTIGAGVQAFTGFDYYVVPNVYIGAEMNIGFNLTNTKPDVGDGTTSWGLGSGVTPMLRLGWKLN